MVDSELWSKGPVSETEHRWTHRQVRPPSEASAQADAQENAVSARISGIWGRPRTLSRDVSRPADLDQHFGIKHLVVASTLGA